MANYKEFDDRLDIGYAGLLSGAVEEAVVFQQWFEWQKRQLRQGLTPPSLSRPQAGRNASSA